MYRRWRSDTTAPRIRSRIAPLKDSTPTNRIAAFCLVWLALALLTGAGTAAAEERILSFHSEIEVDQDGCVVHFRGAVTLNAVEAAVASLREHPEFRGELPTIWDFSGAEGGGLDPEGEHREPAATRPLPRALASLLPPAGGEAFHHDLAMLGELDGIADEVDDDLAHPNGITEKGVGHIGGDMEGELDTLLARADAQGLQRAPERVTEAEGNVLQR